MTAYEEVCDRLREEPRRWLITGVAGFIGSHLLEALLGLGQSVVGIDDFATGSPRNLEDVRSRIGASAWESFTFHRGSVADMGCLREVTSGIDFVLHQAGFVSVPLSVEDPIACHETNVTGTLNLLVAARDHGVKCLVYASSSAVYGDEATMPNVETKIGEPLSPYGASKLMSELYARLFFQHYGFASIGLRYFNVFGPRQNPAGGYAAVIPQWITTLLRGDECRIHGDGTATRDFCHVADVVQANLLAATTESRGAPGEILNVARGGSTTLTELYNMISMKVAALVGAETAPVKHGPPRAGDILHSAADISKIRSVFGYKPMVSVADGLEETVRWYAKQVGG